MPLLHPKIWARVRWANENEYGFNETDEELYKQLIPNEKAWGFLSQNMPLFECPDKQLEQTYYFRWWTYRKYIKQTPAGFIIPEFLLQTFDRYAANN